MLVVSSGGCTAFAGLSNSLEYSECCDDLVMGYRNSAWSARAWHERKDCFQNEPYLYHFRDGFRQGYEDVASGGNGCTPAFPPRSYWGWKFQSPEGQLRVSAWFAGYPHGARAAEEDGLGNYGQIQMSCQMEEACQQCGLGAELPAVPADAPHQHAPAPLTGYEGLLGEGESIVGKVEVKSEASATVHGPAPAPASSPAPAPPPIGSGASDRTALPKPSPF